MTKTTVRTDLLQPLEVITELRVDAVGQDLRVLAINDVPLPVQEPRRDLELRRVLDDRDNALELIRVKLAGAIHRQPHDRLQQAHAPLVEVNVRLLADDVRISTTDTLDLRQGVHDFALAVDIGVKQTENVPSHAKISLP